MNLKSWVVSSAVFLGLAKLVLSFPGHSQTASPALPEPPIAAPHQRVLPLEGGQNFRELGGVPHARWSHDSMGPTVSIWIDALVDAADYAYLGKLGIGTVCDFRDTQERAAEPVEWPTNATPNILSVNYKNVSGIGTPDQSWTAEKARQTMIELYPRLLVQFNGQYRRMFSELLAGHAPHTE